MNRKWIWIGLALLLPVLLLFNVYCTPKTEEEQGIRYLNHHDTVNYVGIDACKTCHADKYATFIETGMGQSFDTASRRKSAAHFTGHDLIFDTLSGYYYHPHWRGDELYITEFRLEGKDTVHKRSEKVSYIIGSGQHTNSHIININGYLYQAPFTWYAQQQRWDMPPGFEKGANSRFQRMIGLECMSCHNAIPTYVPNSENRFATVPKGIDCERCHGPGELHVNLKKQGILVDTKKEVDYSIVNPRKLPWKLQIDVCQRCHLQGNAVLREGKQYTDFRPGMPLSSAFDVFVPATDDPNAPFVMASHAERLQMSPCFIKSNKPGQESKEQPELPMTCITCHNPHISVKVTGKQVFNNACLKCHQTPDACSLPAPERLKVQDNCVQCHMPGSGTSDIPHVSVHDHYIRKPQRTINNAQAIQSFVRLQSVNRAHTDDLTRANAYLNYFERFDPMRKQLYLLDSARFYADKAPESETVDARIRWAYLAGDANALVAVASRLDIQKVSNAWTAYRVGQTYYNQGQYAVAQTWLERAFALAPENLDFGVKLSVCLAQLNKIDQAIALLEQVLKLQPKHITALSNLGYLYFTKNSLVQAKRYYDKALALDADYAPALRNLVQYYQAIGDKAGMKRTLTHLVKHNPEPQLKELLQSL